MTNLMHRLWRSFSTPGLVLAMLCFAASLTPSLLPRSFALQGVLSGLALSAGYAIGVAFHRLWVFMELPGPAGRLRTLLKRGCLGASALIALIFLWQALAWQNSVRALMKLAPLESAHPVKTALVALATFAVLLLIARLFLALLDSISSRLRRVVPRRVALVIGTASAILLFWAVGNGVVFRLALDAADSSYASVDALIEPDVPEPDDPARTGSAASLIRWQDLGRRGREFVSSGPTSADIAGFTGTAAPDPQRIYVGLQAAPTPKERAELALAELKRQNAFSRSVLVIVMPTGTGWIDPSAIDTLEYLQRGDVASVAVQYSYLASWLALMVEPDNGSETARTLFDTVYAYWTTLPKDRRPRLYLHGLSLGAYSSQQSADLFEVIGDPYQGALWAGPPFPSRTWKTMTAERNAGSPVWLPRVRDGSYVRFSNQAHPPTEAQAPWGPMRIVYLQHASDPVTFFESSAVYREPDWMKEPRGPDVSPDFRWYPVVTALQLSLDIALATTSPPGFGHVYAPADYIDAWIEVVDIKGWTAADLDRLKRKFDVQP